MTKRSQVCAILLGTAVGWAAMATVASAEEAAATAPVVAAKKVTEQRVLSLRALLSTGGALEVRGRGGRLDFAMPTPQHGAVENAFLRLSYMNAAPLATDRSRFVVDFNGRSLAELPLTASRAPVSVEISLPPEHFVDGNNELRFSIDQQHHNGCDAESLARLWTSVDPLNSYVVLETTANVSPGRLSDLASIYGDFLAPGAPVGIMTVGSVSITSLEAGGLVAQGIALRTDGRPIDIRHIAVDPNETETADGNFPGLHGNGLAASAHVIVGTKAELQGVVAPHILTKITGPFLGLLPLEVASGKNLLVVSGQDERELISAAQHLADTRHPLPNETVAVVSAAPGTARPLQPFLLPSERYRFEDLAFSKDNLGYGTEARTTVDFLLPPDYYAKDNRAAKLHLNLAYAGGLDSDSLINIAVNGRYAASVPLSDKDGGILHEKEIAIPMRLFQPGRNELSFEPVLSAQASAGCYAVAGTDSRTGVFGDSTIELPEFARIIRMPDLGMLGATAFPFTAPEFGPGQVLVASPDSSTVGAAWTVVAKLAQVSGAPLTELGYSFDAQTITGHALMVGALDDIDSLLLARAPIDVNAVTYALVAPPTRDSESTTTLATTQSDTIGGDRSLWEQRLAADNWFKAKEDERRPGALAGFVAGVPKVISALGPLQTIFADVTEPPLELSEQQNLDAFVVAYESPFAARRMLTIVTARDPIVLQRATSELVKPILWDELGGDFALWSTTPHEMHTTTAGERFLLSDVGRADLQQKRLLLNSYMAEHPWLWIALVATGIVLLAMVSHLFVVARQGR